MKLSFLILLAATFWAIATAAKVDQEATEIRAVFERFSNACNAGNAKEQVSLLSVRYKARLAYFYLVEAEFAAMGQGVNQELGRKWGDSLGRHGANMGFEKTGSSLKMADDLNELLMSWEDLENFSLDQIASTSNLPRPIYSPELSDVKIVGKTATANYTLTTHPGILGLVLDYRDIEQVGLPGLDVVPVKATVCFEKVEGKWLVTLPTTDGE